MNRMSLQRIGTALVVVCSLLFLDGPASANDWPMWRHDANRSAATTEQLPGELHLQWSRRARG